MPPFPWDLLGAETLRSICKDVEVPSHVGRTKEKMVAFLESAQRDGLNKARDAAAAEPPQPRTPAKSASAPVRSSLRKRLQASTERLPSKRQRTISQRAKESEQQKSAPKKPTPKRPARKAAATKATPRSTPRRRTAKPTSRTVFDGVVLSKTNAADEDADGDEDVADEFANEPEIGAQVVEETSAGESNKENEGVDELEYPPEGDADAEGSVIEAEV